MTIQINKAWLSAIIAAILGNIALRSGLTFNSYWADMAAEIIIQYVIPAFTAWVNKTKPKETVRPQDADPDAFVQGG